MEEKTKGSARSPLSEPTQVSPNFRLLKTERKPRMLNVPLRAGRRKLVCACGAKLFVKKLGLFDFKIGCVSCGTLSVSLLHKIEQVK